MLRFITVPINTNKTFKNQILQLRKRSKTERNNKFKICLTPFNRVLRPADKNVMLIREIAASSGRKGGPPTFRGDVYDLRARDLPATRLSLMEQKEMPNSRSIRILEEFGSEMCNVAAFYDLLIVYILLDDFYIIFFMQTAKQGKDIFLAL